MNKDEEKKNKDNDKGADDNNVHTNSLNVSINNPEEEDESSKLPLSIRTRIFTKKILPF